MDDESAGIDASPNQQKGKAQEEARKFIQQIPNDTLIELIADRLQELPGEETKEIIQTVVQARQFSGPIPPPEMLTQYASVNPDIPNRIITMAETQQQHRQTLERQLLEAEIQENRRG